MKPNKKLDLHGYPTVSTPRKTKLSVGFEWEIPILSAYASKRKLSIFEVMSYPPDLTDKDSLSRSSLRSYGFGSHYEQGGLEVQSPAFHLLSTAKMYAKYIKYCVEKSEHLTGKACEFHADNSCAIHVHVKVLKGRLSTPEMITFASLMLNRASSAEFILEFSGRTKVPYSSYIVQAKSTKWDVISPPHIPHSRMVEHNGYGTAEFRLFAGSEDRLLPAIEFSHSICKFLQTRKRLTRPIQNTPVREWGKVVPYLHEWKAWLMKQKGYKVLKADPAMELIKETAQ